jgi:hypothetical protein
VPANQNVTTNANCSISKKTDLLTTVLDGFAGIFNLKNASIGRIGRAVEIVASTNAAHLKLTSGPMHCTQKTPAMKTAATKLRGAAEVGRDICRNTICEQAVIVYLQLQLIRLACC